MKVTPARTTSRSFALWLCSCIGLLLAGPALSQVAIEEIGFVSLPGERFEIELGFNAPPPEPEVFVIANPSRLTMDFPNVSSALSERRFPLEFSTADSLMILEAQGRTRMIVNLTGPAPYSTRVQGNSMIIVVGDESAAAAIGTPSPAVTVAAAAGGVMAAAAGNRADTAAFTAPAAAGNDITGLDFRRGEQGAGQIIIDLARSGLTANIGRNGNRLELEFSNANIDEALQMQLDVMDFATPVQSVSLFETNGNVVVQAQIDGEYDYLAYQSNGQYIVNVSPITAAAAASSAAANPVFSGARISLNFQDIDVRTVLQILADFNDFSLVVGDNVSGNITLRLVNVPWDQALDLVMRSRDLDQRLVGNVLYVAPAAEIAAFELQALESTQQVEALAPLVTEYIEVNYAVASELLTLLQSEGGGGLLSERGRASVDTRTNTLIVQDIATVLDSIRGLLARLDVPVRQVLIEARIVNAATTFSKALGIRWGGAQTFPQFGDDFILSGNLTGVNQVGTGLNDFNRAVAAAVAGGTPLDEALGITPQPIIEIAETLFVDLGVTNPSSSIALGYAGNNGLLQLELTALEASGNGEVIAQPKVTTQDQQTARIESGLQIPFQSQAGGTAGGTTTEFVTAALSLEVTPQITPDGRIIMLLDIHQDSVVPGSGAVPAISTNSVNTRVLVNDGDTVVLGGVFREEVTTTVTKTPLLGDLPYVGNLFKRTEDTENKTELLIFITPSIINDIL